MKVGDIVRSTKVRPKAKATIIRADIRLTEEKKCRTTYTAKFKDGSSFKFYGWDINKTVFKIEENDGQLTIFDFMEAPQ